MDLEREPLPPVGSVVVVATPYESLRGTFVGVVPGRDQAPAVRDRRPKLALKAGGMSASIAERDITAITPEDGQP